MLLCVVRVRRHISQNELQGTWVVLHLLLPPAGRAPSWLWGRYRDAKIQRRLCVCFDSGNEAAPPLKGDVQLPHGTPRCVLPSSSASSSPMLLPQSQWHMGFWSAAFCILFFFFSPRGEREVFERVEMSGAKTHVHLFAPVFTAQPFSPRTVCLLKLTLIKLCMTVL